MAASSSFFGTDGARGVRWFAFRTAANRERAIAKAADLAGIRSFVPSYTEETRWSDRTKRVERLLFPGYVFVCCDPVLDLPYVLQFSGVVAVLPSNLVPVAIEDAEIENVMQAVSAALPVTPATPIIGDTVTIKRGPLKGVSGIVARAGKALRLIVAVELLRRAVSVEIDAADLAKE